MGGRGFLMFSNKTHNPRLKSKSRKGINIVIYKKKAFFRGEGISILQGHFVNCLRQLVLRGPI